jgi:hypothetical protein
VLCLVCIPYLVFVQVSDSHLTKLQRLQNKVLRNIDNFPRHTPVRDIHIAFHLPYMYDNVTKLCRQQAEVIQIYDNKNVRNNGQGEARQRKYKRFNLVAVRYTTVQATRLQL